jgi:hypothetical protein
MTHTLHPEIEKTIQRLVNRIKQDVVTWKEDDVYWLIIWYLWPYLLPPSQHLKDEPTDMKHHRSILLGWDKWATGWDRSCDVYGYYKDWKFYITNIEHTVEDNEPLPESKSKNILQNWQPKVDWSEWDDIQYYRHDGYGWGRRIPGKLKQWVKAIIHAWDIHGIVNFGEIRKPVFEEELKQSTPKIEESLESKFEALSKLVWGLVVLVDEHLDYHKKYKL